MRGQLPKTPIGPLTELLERIAGWGGALSDIRSFPGRSPIPAQPHLRLRVSQPLNLRTGNGVPG
jgi:hypothetical protein